MKVFWAFPKKISTLKREDLTENWQMGMRNWFLGEVPHDSNDAVNESADVCRKVLRECVDCIGMTSQLLLNYLL